MNAKERARRALKGFIWSTDCSSPLRLVEREITEAEDAAWDAAIEAVITAITTQDWQPGATVNLSALKRGGKDLE